MVRDMSHKLMSQLYLLGDEEDSLEQHLKLQAEESALVDEHKSNKDLRTGGLFQGKFRPNPGPRFLPAIHDVEDGVTRCPSCAWELEGGDPRCNHCGYWLNSDGSSSYDSDYEPTDDSVFSQGLPMAGESEYEDDDELDGEMDDEDDDGEVGFPIVSGSPMGVFGMSAPVPPSPAPSVLDRFPTIDIMGLRAYADCDWSPSFSLHLARKRSRL